MYFLAAVGKLTASWRKENQTLIEKSGITETVASREQKVSNAEVRESYSKRVLFTGYGIYSDCYVRQGDDL